MTYRSRSFTQGKKVSFFRDPLTWIWACFKYRFQPLRRPPQVGQQPVQRSSEQTSL